MTKIWPLTVRQTRIKFEIYSDCVQFGGWNSLTKTFDPLRFIDAAAAFGIGTQTQYALDCISLAVEADFFTTREALKSSVFATEVDFLAFCDALAKYDWWLNERHFYAFAVLLDADEFSIRTYAELAQEFREEYVKYQIRTQPTK
jgi:hypothetical protein